MRLLHTSDWHLGRSLHREGLLDHQAAYVDHLLEVVAAEQVDLVIIAGDLYDRALPPVDAVDLASDALTRLSASRADVVVTSGNHDSAQRLGFGSRLLEAAGVYVRTSPAQVGEPIVLADQHGPVIVHALPWLDPTAMVALWSLRARSHEQTLGEAMRRVRGDLTRRGEVRSIAIAHAFVAGAASSESERDIAVGGVSRVPVSTFDGVSYTALGHLHGRHTMSDTVRYSGSPLAYSFSESDQQKGSWLIELGPRGVDAATWVPAPVPRRLVAVSGVLDDLLSNPAYDEAEAAWAQITLTDTHRPAQAMARLRRRFPHALVVRFAPDGVDPGDPAFTPRARVAARSDYDVVLDFVRDLRGTPAASAEADLLRTAVEACCADPEVPG